MSEETILELRDAVVPTRRDADAPALTGVNWPVRAGEFWIVGGTEGTRKSDLLFMLAGLTKPLGGQYILLGQDMTQQFGDESLPHRVRVGMVFDDARLLSHLTIAENVALPARYHQDLHVDESAGWVEALLRATGVADFASNTPSLLSQQWRRRAALARALALRPDVLFLENPLRGLDSRQAVWWISFLKRLWRGHDLMSGRRVTIVATSDEFRPWRNCGAQFASVREGKFSVSGAEAPDDDAQLAQREAAA